MKVEKCEDDLKRTNLLRLSSMDADGRISFRWTIRRARLSDRREWKWWRDGLVN